MLGQLSTPSSTPSPSLSNTGGASTTVSRTTSSVPMTSAIYATSHASPLFKVGNVLEVNSPVITSAVKISKLFPSTALNKPAPESTKETFNVPLRLTVPVTLNRSYLVVGAIPPNSVINVPEKIRSPSIVKTPRVSPGFTVAKEAIVTGPVRVPAPERNPF